MTRRAGFSPPSRYASERQWRAEPRPRPSRREAGLWQRRFWERHVRDEDELAAGVRYCWINPVKHGLVERPEDWPWSSVHRDGRPPVAGGMRP